jgi:hypothetical protein
MNTKKEKSAARKRKFRSAQSEEEKKQATEQLQSRMSALRGNQTPAEHKEASNLDIARLQALRNSQSEEEKEETKYRARKKRGIETEEEGNKRRAENAAR